MPPYEAPRRSRRGLLLLVAGLVVAVLVGTVVVVFALHGSSGTPLAADTSGPSAPASKGHSQSPSPAPVEVRDDFTAASLNGGRWFVYGSNGAGAYSADMVRVQAGELQILGQGRNPTAAANKSGGLCWCVNGDHQYGTWQVRAKFDAGSGYRQVITLWPQSNNEATDGSMNVVSVGDAARAAANVSLQPPGGGTRGSGSLAGDFTAWHVYKVEWRRAYVRIYVDSDLIYDSSTSANPVTIPSAPMHLVLQQDKGPASGIPAANAQTPNAVVMHIDWVQYDP
jgi:hypothetical protein